MSRSVNKVILIGHIGQDPEVKYSPSGSAITNVSVATSESWKDKNTGQAQERTEWHRVVFFNKLGEIAGEYLKKGSLVYIEGQLRTRKWQDKNGEDRYTTEIVGNEMSMLGGKSDSAQSLQQSTASAISASSSVGLQSQRPQSAPQGFDSFDDSDSIPF